MLYAESKNYLINKLKESGLKSKPYTSQKALEKSQESHVGAVLFETESLLLLLEHRISSLSQEKLTQRGY